MNDWGTVGKAAAPMAVGEAVAISGMDDEEAGRDCENVSGPAGRDFSGRALASSGSEILIDKTNCTISNYY